ncbi:MAG: serine/threonine protein kinase [Planctomycetes bacterium]|nr:serine/threonine protein kinase [Planctomycetota bacterium]
MLQTINGFQVLRKVAESNTAEIFHVLRLVGRGRGAEAAIKMLRPEFAADRVERGYLETEYRVCADLDHPNLIRVLELQMSARQPFLVMEYVPGLSLRQHLDRGRPNLADSLDWLAQVADGLAYLHEMGYIHRDVKPQNMVIGGDGTAKVIDFALAAHQDKSLGKYWLRRLREWRRPGTWSYMSPEQIRNERLTAQADIYSLGVSIYETATGHIPFTGETPQELLEQHVYAKVPSMTALREEIPLALDDLVRSMMAKDPLDRPRGMGYVSSKLRSAIRLVRKGE